MQPSELLRAMVELLALQHDPNYDAQSKHGFR